MPESKSKHTPGPWHIIGGDDRSKRIVYRPDDILVGYSSYSNSRTTGEEHVNARLIAAAPDLLEALKAAIACGMVPVSSAAEGGANKYSAQVAVADQIRAAIAKAEGTDL